MSRETFIDIITGRKQMARHNIRSIIKQAAEEHGFTVADILRRDRKKAVSHARHEAILRAYETGIYSMPQLGRAFGGRDHTTILNSIKKGRVLRQKGN